MNAVELLERIPPAEEIREELGRQLRRVDALKQLLKVAEKRGDDSLTREQETAPCK